MKKDTGEVEKKEKPAWSFKRVLKYFVGILGWVLTFFSALIPDQFEVALRMIWKALEALLAILS